MRIGQMDSGNPRFAIIDVGSNTIKLLVAERGDDGGLVTLEQRSLDTRISAGIGSDIPQLGEKGIAEGAAAVKILTQKASLYHPSRIIITATSAVRDAGNKMEFAEAVFAKTGLNLRILSDIEEARYIALGAAQDPFLSGLERFQMVDLGGGSLEFIDFSEGFPIQAISLKLGAVRLMELHVENARKPMVDSEIHQITQTVRKRIIESGFQFANGEVPLVGSGGAFSYTRSMLAREKALKQENTPNRLDVADIEKLFSKISAMTIEERCSLPGLPPTRADIFPVALLTLSTLARVAQRDSFLHTFYNLRFGLAAEFFSEPSQKG